MSSSSKVGAEYFDRAYWQDATKSGYKDYSAGWWIHQEIAAMLAHAYDFPFDGRILDVGGCFGYHAGILAELTGATAFVVDISSYAINNADRRVNATQLDAGTTALPFPGEYFNFVFSIETLEHIHEPEVPFALSEIARVLKPGAPFYASIALERSEHKLDHPEDDKDASHQTMKPRRWWHDRITWAGLVPDPAAEHRLRTYRSGEKRRLLVRGMDWAIFPYRKPKGTRHG